MKLFFLFLSLCIVQVAFAQKNPVIQASNLNLSKSNINRLVYPSSMLSAANAQLILAELDEAGLSDSMAIRRWLAPVYKRVGINPDIVRVFFFSGREFSDCKSCTKNCGGRCVQDPGAACVCISRSEPNLRVNAEQKIFNVILFTNPGVSYKEAMDQVSSAFQTLKPQVISSQD